MKLVLLGAGGHCRSCIEVAESAGVELAGVLSVERGEETFGYPLLGDDTWLDRPEAAQMQFLVAVGQVGVSPLRRKLFDKLAQRKLRHANLKAASVSLSARASIGEGGVLMHRAVVNAGAVLGQNCIINTGALIEHDATIGAHCHISTGAIVNGGVRIGEGSMVGSGAVILQGVQIGPGVMIGAGAVVTRDIPEPGTWAGVPARRLA